MLNPEKDRWFVELTVGLVCHMVKKCFTFFQKPFAAPNPKHVTKVRCLIYAMLLGLNDITDCLTGNESQSEI